MLCRRPEVYSSMIKLFQYWLLIWSTNIWSNESKKKKKISKKKKGKFSEVVPFKSQGIVIFTQKWASAPRNIKHNILCRYSENATCLFFILLFSKTQVKCSSFYKLLSSKIFEIKQLIQLLACRFTHIWVEINKVNQVFFYIISSLGWKGHCLKKKKHELTSLSDKWTELQSQLL